MPAEIRAFRCLSDNIGALVHDPATGACAAVDAPEEAPIVAALEEAGWTLSEIIVTHRHADHVKGIEALKRRYGCRVLAPEKARGEVPAVDAPEEAPVAGSCTSAPILSERQRKARISAGIRCSLRHGPPC